MGLENMLDPGKKKPSGKAHLSKTNITFDKYLEMQLKDKDFSSRFIKNGDTSALARSKSSGVAEPQNSFPRAFLFPQNGYSFDGLMSLLQHRIG